MAHIGFKKLEGMLAKKGAKNPGAVAAKIGKDKYGSAAMKAGAAAHKALKESQAKKK